MKSMLQSKVPIPPNISNSATGSRSAHQTRAEKPAAPLVFNCPVEAALNAIGGKWKPVILWHLHHGPRRFSELRRAIPRVTEKVLIEQLRQLERSGVVARQVVESVPPMVTYSLTPHGLALKQAILDVSVWGIHHAAQIGAQILIIDNSHPEAVKSAVTTES